ncbi:MAG: VOC family protein [Paracoccaceae bacterium]
MTLRIDHLAVSCGTLAEGVAAMEALLGVPMALGGQHAHMGTHNRLVNLGDLYLEVIAVDPTAPAPGWPRWFDLDNFTGAPRLTNWVAACDEIGAEVAASPAGVGVPVALSRGDFRWQMAVPADGRLPFAGTFPALIQWEGAAHPAVRLPDMGLRLDRLILRHPDVAGLQKALSGRMQDARLTFETGAPGLEAHIQTPQGQRVLR